MTNTQHVCGIQHHNSQRPSRITCQTHQMYSSRNLIYLLTAFSIAILLVTYFNSALLPTSSLHIPPTFKRNTFTYQQDIVKIIHQSWKTTTLPARFAQWSQSWKACFPSWKYILWTDKDNRDFVAQHYPWMLQFYDNLPKEIYRADAVRYVYLYHYGGLYVDLDAECLRPFDHLLTNFSIVFGAMEGQSGPPVKEGHIENSFMYSQPKHPFWMRLIEDMMERKTSTPGHTTGPFMLADNINRYRGQYGREFMIYPPLYFDPYSWIYPDASSKCSSRNKMTDDDVKQCRKYYMARGSYVLQYHTQTWGMGKIV